MKLFALFLICLSALCESGLGLSVHGGASLSYPYIRVVPEEVMARRNTGTGAEAASTTLSRRSPRLDRSTIITIIVGAIGGVAMVATLSLAILLLIRKQRQKARGLAQSSTKAHFPTGSNPAPPDALSPKTKERPYYGFQHFPSAPPSPPQAAPRVDNMESVWFGTDKSGEKAQSRRAMSPPGRQTVRKKTSRQRVDAEQKPSISVETSPTPALATTLPLARRSESDSVAVEVTSKSSKRIRPLPLPQSPAHDPERPPSPITFRQPEIPLPVTLSPRPRGSSLSRGAPPALEVAVPLPSASGHHVTSVSEDRGPVSRFSISPVAPSFPSRLTRIGSSLPSSHRSSRRHTRLRSLSTLVHSRSDAAPDVPTDVIE